MVWSLSYCFLLKVSLGKKGRSLSSLCWKWIRIRWWGALTCLFPLGMEYSEEAHSTSPLPLMTEFILPSSGPILPQFKTTDQNEILQKNLFSLHPFKWVIMETARLQSSRVIKYPQPEIENFSLFKWKLGPLRKLKMEVDGEKSYAAHGAPFTRNKLNLPK